MVGGSTNGLAGRCPEDVATMIESPEVEFAVAAVREAALLVRQIQTELVGSALTKDDRSPVTVADFAAQALVAKRLSDRFPDALLVGEENADALRDEQGSEFLPHITRFVQNCVPQANADRVLQWIDRGSNEPPAIYWTLDPVDGTKGFLRGDQYAVALALVTHGRVEVGVLGCPQLARAHQPALGGEGTLVAAARGRGSYMSPIQGEARWQRLSVSDRSSSEDARLLRSVESAHTNTGAIGELVSATGVQAPPVPMDSQAKYAVLAAGHGDVLLRLLSSSRPDYREKVWDQAAGSLVVEEAGGRVTDLDGKQLDFARGRTLANNRGIVATNGRLHEAMLAGLREIGG